LPIETNLAPSQTPHGSLRGIKIYHENPSTESQLVAAGGGSSTPGIL
jgi:hypothetical protein